MQINSLNEIEISTVSLSNNTNTTPTTEFSSYLVESTVETDGSQTIEDLVADLISIIKTGLSVSELEHLQKLLSEIQKLMKERSEEEMSASTKADIKSMIDDLKEDMLALQKKMFGQVIIDAESLDISKENSNDSSTLSSLTKEINSLQKTINELNDFSGFLTDKISFEAVDIEISSDTIPNIQEVSKSELIQIIKEYRSLKDSLDQIEEEKQSNTFKDDMISTDQELKLRENLLK